MRAVYARLLRFAPLDATVLVEGERGTEKELAASRAPRALAAPARALRPRSTGDDGLFQAARGGTIFLDEVGEVPLDLQAKLLRAIEERVDVRVVAASSRELESAARRGHFREDLYFRLSAFVLALSPLRERPGDIPSPRASLPPAVRARAQGGDPAHARRARAARGLRVARERHELETTLRSLWPAPEGP